MEKPCFCIPVVSDSVYKGEKKDVSGILARDKLISLGYTVKEYIIVPNSYREIHKQVLNMVKKGCDALLVIGGTGPSPRDISIDVVEELSWRKLPGFGELFRRCTFEKEGYIAVYSRAGAYVVGDSIVFVVPGSPNAVEVALDIIVHTVDHIVEEIRRYEGKHHKH